MPAYLPNSDHNALATRLNKPHRGLVMCFCAAWCDACRAYQPKFDALSGQYPDWIFVWADIEEHPELLGDEDVENFPTLLIRMSASAKFFGPMLPHIDHLQRLLDSLDDEAPGVVTALPPDLAGLLAADPRQSLPERPPSSTASLRLGVGTLDAGLDSLATETAGS